VPTVLLVPRPRVPVRWLLVYGLGFGTVQFLFLFVAMDVGMPNGLASLVLQASAPFTVLLGAVFLRERLSARQGVGIGLAVAGMVAIAASRAQEAALLPVVLTLVGALGWRSATWPTGWRCGTRRVRSTRCTWCSGCRWCRRCRCWPRPGSPRARRPGATPPWRPSALRGCPGWPRWPTSCCSAPWRARGIWTALMRRYPAGVVAPYSLLVPVVGIGLAAVVLGERPGRSSWWRPR
jgi:drug/metabolite transporter (DMT)-like permease